MPNYVKIIFFSSFFSTFLFASSTVFVSFVGSVMDYKEYDSRGVLVDSESTTFRDLVGFELGYSYVAAFENFAIKTQIEYMHIEGESKYVGSYLTSNASYGSLVASTYNTIDQGKITAKGIIPLSSVVNLKLAVGIGYYQWERALSVTQVEQYSWYPLIGEIGTTFKLFPSCAYNLNIDFFYQKGMFPKMDAYDLGYTFDLGAESDYGVKLGIVYEVSPYVNLYGTYIYDYQEITHSNVINNYYEPDSTDAKHYVKVGLGYNF